jgi:hypothetical protein
MVRARRALGLVGVALLGLGLVGTAARAQTGGDVITGIGLVATSDGVGATFGDPKKQPNPVGAAQMAHTEATLSTGPTGYALASTAWPGPLVANAGSLAVLLGGTGTPEEVRNANYAGRAEAFSPAGPNDAALGPGMKAHARDNVAEATAAAQNVVTSPGFSTGNVATTSRSTLESSGVVAFTQSMTSDISFGAGLVAIDSVQTLARATSDGRSAEAEGFTVVNGLEINGQDATVDENGVRFTDPVVGPLNEQLLSNFGIEMFVSKPQVTDDGPAASYRSGSLIVVWTLGDSGYIAVYTIGGSEARARETLGSAYTPPSFTQPTVPPSVGGFVPPIESTETTTAAIDQPVATTTPPSDGVSSFAPISFVRELGLWPYVLGLLFTAVAAWGLRRVREDILTPTTDVTCPLEVR